jgi:hypothetical protein
VTDKIFEPLMAADGWLARTPVGAVIGVGQGRGAALLLVTLGCALAARHCCGAEA